jgi:hypothetical protein
VSDLGVCRQLDTCRQLYALLYALSLSVSHLTLEIPSDIRRSLSLQILAEATVKRECDHLSFLSEAAAELEREINHKPRDRIRLK